MATAATGPMTAAGRRRALAVRCAATDTVAVAMGAGMTALVSTGIAGTSSSDMPSSWKQRQQYVRVAGLRVSQRWHVVTGTGSWARSAAGQAAAFPASPTEAAPFGSDPASSASQVRQKVSSAETSAPQYRQAGALSTHASR
jgi:hypothetical protein